MLVNLMCMYQLNHHLYKNKPKISNILAHAQIFHSPLQHAKDLKLTYAPIKGKMLDTDIFSWLYTFHCLHYHTILYYMAKSKHYCTTYYLRLVPSWPIAHVHMNYRTRMANSALKCRIIILNIARSLCSYNNI